MSAILALLSTLSTAHAACDELVALDALTAEIEAFEADVAAATDPAAAVALEGSLGCLSDVLERSLAPRALRATGARYALSGDLDRGEMWLSAAAVLDDAHTWEGVAEDSPLIGVWAAAVEAAGYDETELEGTVLGPGDHYVDGRKVSWPYALDGALHVYQHRSETGELNTWLVEGVDFPSEHMVRTTAPAPEPVVAPVPAPAAPENPTPQTVSGGVTYPPERIALISGGGALIAGGVAMYVASGSSLQRFDDASLRQDAESARATTNALVLASGVAVAAGVGTAGFGVLYFIIDGGPRAGVTLRW